MEALLRKAAEWVDRRTGFETALRNFLFEEIPGSAGWAQVFGSVALFLFLTQAMTGLLLAFNYAPTPGEAHESLLYITGKVKAGKMIQGLHHWGASLMIVVVFVHMVQVFLYGAYKKPREVTWIVGAVLLLLTLAFGLTGYLLPWDNRAYWGTMVTTRIIASAPLVGNLLLRLIGAANGIGVVTFSRFYTLHTILLPALMIFLVSVHVLLVLRHGITPSRLETKPTQKFYPKQAFRDTVAVFLSFAILFAAAALLQVPLERVADPTNTTYVPRPEWYFLFLFELLKLFQGSLEPIGTIVLPALAVLALFAIPFVDRAELAKANRRVLAAGTVAFTLAGWAALTGAAILTSPPGSSSLLAGAPAAEWAQLPADQIAGLGYYRSAHCNSCHNLLEGEPKLGPNLTTTGIHYSRPWLIQHFSDPRQQVPNADASPTHFSLPQLNALSLFVANLTPDTASKLLDVPPTGIEGAEIFVVSGCGGCHKINGTGGSIGPSLNGLVDRRSKQWVKAHFLSPQKLSPGSIMPPYHFSPDQENAIVTYLFTLPE